MRATTSRIKFIHLSLVLMVLACLFGRSAAAQAPCDLYVQVEEAWDNSTASLDVASQGTCEKPAIERYGMINYAFAIVLTLLQVATGASATNPFSITIQVPQNTSKVGTPIKVLVTLENTSSAELPISESTPEQTFVVQVLDQHGKQPPRTRLGRVLKGEEKPSNFIYDRRESVLAPREKITRELTLNKIYDLTLPGRYSVRVCRTMKSGQREVCSNHLTVLIANSSE